MKIALKTASILFVSVISVGAITVDHQMPASGNAALQYWAAFSEVRDSVVSAEQAKELNSVLDGTAPYDDSRYQDLVRKNQLALKIMSRGTRFRVCDWGLDYDLGADMPVEYAREALTLGRLNVLYTLHLLNSGDTEGVVHALVAGLRFSHDVGNGGSLFATTVANRLLKDHLRAIADVVRLGRLTADQNSRLRKAVAELSQGLDWSSAMKRDLELLSRDYAQNPQGAAALNRIKTIYIAAVSDQSNWVSAEQAIKAAPKDLANVIPNLGGVLKQKQDLLHAISQTRAALQ